HELTSSSEITSTAWTAGRRESHPTDNDRVAGERSERDIVVVATTVVRVVETSASGGGRIVVSAIVAARGSSAATAGPGENDVAGDNLRPVALVAVPILVARSPKSPFDEQASSLGQKLTERFGPLAPHDHAVPLGAFLPLAIAVEVGLRGGEPHLQHGLTAVRHA